jgi:glycosyltransferase family protein
MGKIKEFFHNWIYAHVTVPLRYYRFSKLYHIMNNKETVNYIIRYRCSVARFGDYEYMSLNEESNNFNEANHNLAQRLKDVLKNKDSRLLVCIPKGFSTLRGLRKNAAIFWRYYVAEKADVISKATPKDTIYGDASFTRFYMDAKKKDSQKMSIYIDNLRRIWQDRDVYIVEGEGSRFGVADDFLDNSRIVKRILCPSTDAFKVYDKILYTVKENVPKEALILSALGATATVLAFDLSRLGFQCIDIGHADIEYSWFKMGATHKVPVKGKNVNEVGINNVASSDNDKYLKEIIYNIQKL